ncbi:MAG: hypothetical protein KTR32_05080 [Granulosicoccus sp.]|nr:hypothetical protein [Granulosicoccus sp.]
MQTSLHQFHSYQRFLLFGLLTAAILVPRCLLAFEELTAAQTLIYDSSHLAKTTEGQSIEYHYKGQDNNQPEVNDSASLTILASHAEDRRDVEVEFLSDERRLPLPPFNAYRGNPVIIAMLEHIALSMSAQTSGGALYFRNRIRDALASKDIELNDSVFVYGGDNVDSKIMTFSPFTNDQFLGAYPVLKTTQFTIHLSDDVPGGLISIDVSASEGDQRFERHLTFQQ